MKLRLVPVVLVAACAVAGCDSTTQTTEAAAPPTPPPASPTLMPASMASPPTGTFGTVLTLPVTKSSPLGKGVVWWIGSYQKTDTSVTVDWHDTPSAKCGRASAVRLDETSASIIIQLVPGKPTVSVCSSDSHSFTMNVPLSAPIGSRSILRQ